MKSWLPVFSDLLKSLPFKCFCGVVLASTNVLASSGQTALGFVGSDYEKPETTIPSPVVREAQKALDYELSADQGGMICSGFAIEQNGRNYFVTAAHCITKRLRSEWSSVDQAMKDALADPRKPKAANNQLNVLVDFMSKQSWSVLLSQGIGIQYCSDYEFFVEHSHDLEAWKYCGSKAQTVKLNLKFIANNILTWFVAGDTPDSVLDVVPFYDVAIFEIEQPVGAAKLATMTLATNDGDEDIEYAVGFAHRAPVLSFNGPGSPVYKPLNKRGLAISWGPKTLTDAPAILKGADGDAALKALDLTTDSWQQESNVFLSFTKPGMSGGPILNSKGEVIGLLTGSPTFTKDMDYNSMLTVGPPLKMIKMAISKIK